MTISIKCGNSYSFSIIRCGSEEGRPWASLQHARDSTSLSTGSRSECGTSDNLARISESLIRRSGRCFFVIYGAIGDVSGLAESFEILDPNGSVFGSIQRI